MKEWNCIEAATHRSVAEKIIEAQKEGWSLHTYTTGGHGGGVNHYLLFEREL